MINFNNKEIRTLAIEGFRLLNSEIGNDRDENNVCKKFISVFVSLTRR